MKIRGVLHSVFVARALLFIVSANKGESKSFATPRTEMVTLCEVGCAAVSGVVGRGLVFPLDTIKTVTSVAESGGGSSSAAPTFWRVCARIHASDGVLGFYRGLGIAAAASAPGVALYISSYEHCKAWLERRFGGTAAPLQHLTAGVAAEAVSCVVWVPVDVVKERMQSQHREVEGRYRSSWHGLTTLVRLEGVRGVYKGYFSTLGSFGPFSAVYFGAYEAAQGALRGRKATQAGAPPATLSALEMSLAAAIGNVVACVVVNPLEVSKTRYQVHRALLETSAGEVRQSQQFQRSVTSMLDALRWSVKHEGLAQLWTRGLVARILFQTPSAAITFGCYAWLKARVCGSSEQPLSH
jgi:hypothetical protein